MSEDTEKAISYDKWVKTCMNLLPQNNDLSFYKLLHKLNRQNEYLYLLDYTINLESNIKRYIANRADKPNIVKLIEEIRDAILLNNFNSLFYSNLILTENIVDLVIVNNLKKSANNSIYKTILIKLKKFFDKETQLNQYEVVYNWLCDGKYSWGKKEEFISKAMPIRERTDEFKIFLRFLKVIYLIRNRFMFHLNNYEYYTRFYPKISEKEKLLIKPLKTIVKVIKEGKNDFKKIKKIEFIAEECKKELEKIINWLENNKSSRELLSGHHSFYSKFPEIFAKFSNIIIILFGRPKINITKENTWHNEINKFVKEPQNEIK